MVKKYTPYDTYKVFFTINFENASIANNLKTSNGISISNYFKTSNGIKYYNPDKKKYCIIIDENTAIDWVKSLYYYNPINELIVLPDDFKDDGKHALIINHIDAGICNDKGQFTLRKMYEILKSRTMYYKHF